MFTQGLIGWNDPAHSYDRHNLIFDIPWKGQRRKRIIEGNTRGTAVIRENEAYVESSFASPGNGSVVHEEGATPRLFSIIKHYPPPWVLKLRASAAQQSNNNNKNSNVQQEESKDISW